VGYSNPGDKLSSAFFTDSAKLVAFLEDQPFDVFAQHKVGETEPTAYVCLQTMRIDQPCPLCEIVGDPSRNVFAFNIAVLSGRDLGSPITCVALFAEADFSLSLIRASRNNSDTKSIADGYWSISVRKIQSKPDYIFSHVRSSDLWDEWNLDPAEVACSLKELKLFDHTIVEVTPPEALLEVARKLASKS